MTAEVAAPYWVCAGCQAPLPSGAPPAACPAAQTGDDIDHILVLRNPPAGQVDVTAAQPFIRYRERLSSWARARRGGMSDADFVARVASLDAQIAALDGGGFRVTAAAPSAALSELLGAEIWLKDETTHVGGSHKARHLMGIAIDLMVREALGDASAGRPLAIASCGNAALAAAVVARAAGRSLAVYIPEDAKASVVARLRELGAHIHICPRDPAVVGDPCYAAFKASVASGQAQPFCCQGPDCGLAIEGGETMAWELAEAATFDAVYIQVGGGAFGTALWRGWSRLGPAPRLMTVQTEGCAPLARAWKRTCSGAALDTARHHRSEAMWPWDQPHSIAHGILDDETYDWAALVEGMHQTGGAPVVVTDDHVREATRLIQAEGIAVSPTGASGLAGVLAQPPAPGERVAVMASGIAR